MKLIDSISEDISQHSPAKSSSTTGTGILAKESLMRPISFLDGIFKPISDDSLSTSKWNLPIPDITNQYYFMRVQISGHSSVQSSSTFRSRKADKLIYILMSKKIEQGQLLYPKIFPPIFFKVLTSIISICLSLLKGCTVQTRS